MSQVNGRREMPRGDSEVTLSSHLRLNDQGYLSRRGVVEEAVTVEAI